MDLRLRQLCLAAASKDETVSVLRDVFDLHPVHGSGDLSAYGLPAKGPMSEGGRAFLAAQGVENLLFAAGRDFIEVLFPTDADSSVARFIARRGGSGAGYMVILQDGDLSAYQDAAAATGVRIIHEARYAAYADIQYHPKDAGGALLCVASHLPENVVDGPWYPAGTAWEQMTPSTRIGAIAGARFFSDSPETLARRWAALLGRDVENEGGAWRIDIDGSALRFAHPVEALDEGFAGIDLRALDREATVAAARAEGLDVTDGVIRYLGLAWRLVA